MDETAPLLAATTVSDSFSRRPTITAIPEGRDLDLDVPVPVLQQVRSLRFDPNGDPSNPQDWPMSYKYGVLALLACMSFTTAFTCVGIIPIARGIVQDVEGREDKGASVLLVTIWELGEAAGPLLTAPLSEVYGRYPVYNIANTLFIVGTFTVALSRHAGLLIFARFLTGLSVASNVLNPSIVGDIFPVEQRGSAISVVFLTSLIGAAISPAIGGALAQNFGWRAVVWCAAAVATSCECAFFCLFRETYSVKILEKRAKKEIGCDTETSTKVVRALTGEEVESSSWSAIWVAVSRPARVFYNSSVLQVMSLFGSIGSTFYYVMSTSFPDILRDVYHLDEGQTGVSFLSYSLGCVLGIFICHTLIDRIYLRLSRPPSSGAPEHRLPLVILGCIILPVAAVLYGLTASSHWPLAILLSTVCLLGFGLVLGIVPLMAYIVDAFGIYSASATTAILLVRCVMCTFLPLGVGPLVRELGYASAFAVVAAVCALVVPIPICVMRWGGRWRAQSEYTKAAAEAE